MHVVVTYESRTGNTEKAAHLVAEGLHKAGVTVSAFPVDAPDYGALAAADAVIVGTWCGGLFFFGQHPGGAGKIAGELPDLCLLYTSPSPRDGLLSRMPSSA